MTHSYKQGLEQLVQLMCSGPFSKRFKSFRLPQKQLQAENLNYCRYFLQIITLSCNVPKTSVVDTSPQRSRAQTEPNDDQSILRP